MVVIPAGRFEMGSLDGNENEQPVHSVAIRTFELGKTEVTQAQWRAVMGSNPSKFRGCDDCPVENVGWNDAKEFLEKLNAKTAQIYRLPTEAEWEYACRAGSRQEYCGGGSPDGLAWSSNNSGGKTHPVAGKQANAFGIYDLSGNVWEWVEDCYHLNYDGAPGDGTAWSAGDCTDRVLRGGSWFSGPEYTRSSNRVGHEVGFRNSNIGFRVARTLN
jgi:formylglycine-generating enzyme required for sulfatase activity